MSKCTLNPFENAKRTAKGTGGGSVTPEQIEALQAEIDILGSENATQTQDITDIKSQLLDLASAYSTTEHKTGRKWTDGKDIYEKSIVLENTTIEADKAFNVCESTGIDKVFPAEFYSSGENGGESIATWIASGYVKAKAFATYSQGTVIVTIRYTKGTV